MFAPTRRFTRPAMFAFFAGWAGLQSGCCQYPCYPPPGYPVTTQPAAIRQGSICDTDSSGATVITRPATNSSSSVIDAPRPRVVVSEPTGRLAGQPSWRRANPESLATTRSEGALDDSTINR